MQRQEYLDPFDSCVRVRVCVRQRVRVRVCAPAAPSSLTPSASWSFTETPSVNCLSYPTLPFLFFCFSKFFYMHTESLWNSLRYTETTSIVIIKKNHLTLFHPTASIKTIQLVLFLLKRQCLSGEMIGRLATPAYETCSPHPTFQGLPSL